MKLGDIYRETISLFKDKISNSHLEVILILSLALNRSKEYIIAHEELELSQTEIDRIKELREKRLSGIPYAYLKKEKEFFGIKFFVEEGALIPRPETEVLVETVLKNEPFNKGLDLFCGSGIIGLTILYKNGCEEFLGIDISQKCIDVSIINASKLGLINRTRFIRADIRDLCLKEDFDLITANPPYIPDSEWEKLDIEVKNEPKEALLGGKDGLDFYPEIARIITTNLIKGGLFAVEIGGKVHVDRVKQIFKRYNIRDINVVNDLNDIPRVIWGRK